jgi:hypothetical protein
VEGAPDPNDCLLSIFKNRADKDQAYFCARALKIQAAVARRIPGVEALFRPVP